MSATEARRTPEELAQLGAEAFDRHVRPKLRPEDDGKFVAIDVVTGDHEIDKDDYDAVMRLRARRPSAEPSRRGVRVLARRHRVQSRLVTPASEWCRQAGNRPLLR